MEETFDDFWDAVRHQRMKRRRQNLTLSATQSMEILNAFMEAGFTREEAFDIVLVTFDHALTKGELNEQ